jgi:peptidoglycan hydrolase-like protein with peptidoglycan-binding domain
MNLIPKSFQRLSHKEKVTTVVLGAVAVGGVLLMLDKFARSQPRAYANLYSVRGTWTDMASKLGITIGADLDVKTAQKYLNQIQNAGLDVNGVLDSATSDAIRKFQNGNGISPSGVIDEETGNALQYFYAATSKSPALQNVVTLPDGTTAATTTTTIALPKPWADAVTKDGRMGPAFTDLLPMSIKGAQKALNDIFGLAMPLTGLIDSAAQGAIKTFQAQQGLPVTGQLDSETSNALLYMASHLTLRGRPARATAAAPAGAPPALTAAQKRQLAAARAGSALDLGQGWLAIAQAGGGVCACKNDDISCIQSCGGAQAHAATGWGPAATAWGPAMVGLQSTTMYDPRFYYGDPKPYFPASNVDFSEEP